MKKKSKTRLWMQMGFFLIIALIAINHGLGSPYFGKMSLRPVCPFGAVSSLYSILTTGFMQPQIRPANLLLLSIMFFLSLILGPVFCGWVCPLGSTQEWLGKLGKKFWGKRYNHWIPERVVYYFGFLRYGVLGLVIYVTARSGSLLFSQIDPYHALFHFWTGEVAIGAIIALLITLFASLFIERPWCKFACPLGAVLGLFNKIRIFSIRRNPETCVSCHLCSTACPMNIVVEKKESVRDARCISCLKCLSGQACPKTETVTLSLPPLKGGKTQ